MSAHTPGPWSAADRNESVFVPIKSVYCERIGYQICFVNTGRASINTESEANTRLISAAPDLLDALQTIAADLQSFVGQQYREIETTARNAIFKATGAES